ncbi:hypothetical protein FPOA_07633 [Fusarium poae]|uniref:Uncharacterized protein n=1 Tax=Fusarium poae TaxID=36050 RepID=A0A1B8AKZ5_FUSPO|nr:hypothetical protein FPOA_07633 [Fusarium poae]
MTQHSTAPRFRWPERVQVGALSCTSQLTPHLATSTINAFSTPLTPRHGSIELPSLARKDPSFDCNIHIPSIHPSWTSALHTGPSSSYSPSSSFLSP